MLRTKLEEIKLTDNASTSNNVICLENINDCLDTLKNGSTSPHSACKILDNIGSSSSRMPVLLMSLEETARNSKGIQVSVMPNSQTSSNESNDKSNKKSKMIIKIRQRLLSEIRQGVLFLHKPKKKISRNFLFVKNPQSKTENINKIDESCTKLDDLCSDKQETENKNTEKLTYTQTEQCSSKENSEILSNNKAIKNRKKDSEMVILFVNENKSSQDISCTKSDTDLKRQLWLNRMTKSIRQGNDEFCMFKNRPKSNMFSKKNNVNTKIANKTTSTSTLNDLNTSSISTLHDINASSLNDKRIDAQLQTISNELPKSSEIEITNKVSTMKIENKLNIPVNQFSYINHEKRVMIDDKMIKFKIPYYSNNKVQSIPNFICPKTADYEENEYSENIYQDNYDLYASFNKNYIPVSKCSLSRTQVNTDSIYNMSEKLPNSQNNTINNYRSLNQIHYSTPNNVVNKENYLQQNLQLIHLPLTESSNNAYSVQNQRVLLQFNQNNNETLSSVIKTNEMKSINNLTHQRVADECFSTIDKKIRFLDALYSQSVKKFPRKTKINDVEDYNVMMTAEPIPFANTRLNHPKMEKDELQTEITFNYATQNNSQEYLKHRNNTEQTLTCLDRFSSLNDYIFNSADKINDNTNLLLSEQFKRDYISVRGKSLKIDNERHNCTMSSQLNISYSIENSGSAFKNIINFSSAQNRNEHNVFSLKLPSLNESDVTVFRHSSKISICISDSGSDSDDDLDTSNENSEKVENGKCMSSVSQEHLASKKPNTIITGSVNQSRTRVYSDLSVAKKCKSVRHKTYIHK